MVLAEVSLFHMQIIRSVGPWLDKPVQQLGTLRNSPRDKNYKLNESIAL